MWIIYFVPCFTCVSEEGKAFSPFFIISFPCRLRFFYLCPRRERVKRKKAKAEAEAARTSLPAADEKKQPDLVVLSKVLPPGWQAYWDESTKGVYYGNTITSETTWTRPTS